MIIRNNDVKRFEKINNIELPKDIKSEEILIGSILSNPKFMFKTEYLKARMFYDTKHATIYHIVGKLLNEGIENVDTLMVENGIISNKAFKDYFSGISDIRSYLDMFKENARMDVEGVEYFAKNIVSEAFKRDSYIKLQEMSKNVLINDGDINKVNELIQTEVVKFADEYIFDDDVKAMEDICDGIYARLEENQELGCSGIESVFPDLKEYFYYEPGEVVLLGGRTGGYKTVYFMIEALHKASQGITTVIVDTECSTDLWVARALSNISGVSIRKIKTGVGMTAEDREKYEGAKEFLKKLPIYHIYKPELDMNELYMLFKQMVITKNLGFIIVDYLKVTNTRGLDSNQYDELGNLAIELKTIAGLLNIPVLTGGQLLPNTERLADSSKISRYISTELIWTPKTAEEKTNDGVEQGNFRMKIVKNRNGRLTEDDCYLNFVVNGDLARIHQAKIFEHRAGDNTPY